MMRPVRTKIESSKMGLKFVLLLLYSYFILINAQGTELKCGKSSQMDLQLPAGTDSMIQAADWPWLVSIFNSSNSELSYICGGSLVSRSHVVTVAHCLKHGRFTLEPDDVFVKPEMNTLDETFNNSIPVEEITVHQSTPNRTFAGVDLAILTLIYPLNLSDRVTPVCTWDSSLGLPRDGVLGTVVGWGEDHTDVQSKSNKDKYEYDSESKRLQLIRMRLATLDQCRASDSRFKQLTSHDTLCAGNRDGFGPCLGFGGSGLFVLQGSSRSGTFWSLRGVLSRALTRKGASDSNGLCDLHQYSIFVDTARLAPWINSVVRRGENYTEITEETVTTNYSETEESSSTENYTEITEETVTTNYSDTEESFSSTYIIIAAVSSILSLIFIICLILYIVKYKKCCMATPLSVNTAAPTPQETSREPTNANPFVGAEPAYLEMLEGPPVYDEIVERPESNFYDVVKEQAYQNLGEVRGIVIG